MTDRSMAPRVATLPVVGPLPPLALTATGLLAAIGLGAGLGLVSALIAGFASYLLVLAVGAPLFLYLAIRHYDQLVMASFVIFGVVQLEPAPFDGILAGLFAIGLLTGRLDPRRLADSRRVHSLVFALMVVVMASTTMAGELTASFRYTAITIYCVSIMYFVKMFVRSERDAARIMMGYLVGAMIMVAFVFGDLAGVVPDEFVLEQGRARGFFQDSNVFGPFLVPLFILLVDEIRHPRLFATIGPRLRVVAAGLTVVAIFLTYSRAAWGNLILTSSLYFLAAAKAVGPRQIARFAGWGVIGVAGLVAVATAFGQAEFLTERAVLVQSYDSERFDAQRTGIELGLNNLIGIGPGMTDTGELFAPHSIYVRALAETGVIGLVLLLALLAAIVGPILSSARNTRPVYGIRRPVLVAAVIGHLANGFLIDTLHWRHFWLLLGLVWLAHGRRMGASPNPVDPARERIGV